MPQQIVIGVDRSENSLDALVAAADPADQTGSQPSVGFARDPGLAGAYEPAAAPASEQTVPEFEATVRGRSSAALGDKRVEWTFDIATGDVTHELVSVAQRRDARLIIVGGHRHSAGVGVVRRHSNSCRTYQSLSWLSANPGQTASQRPWTEEDRAQCSETQRCRVHQRWSSRPPTARPRTKGGR